ncbi:Membrane protein tms1 [Recurvomyces mirabilis]|uniref:Membrane protein tms1 n=1 Tax=Recurvomyces mirabilis TaxID=574656 RepID=A0AAE0TPU8_9PEZI|nr:Membrane protein tms1 [Recurvomyces mirabilis]KAK5156146.1 Membrane protein tms1 [Recurvomyces mirabilis]
MGALLSLPLLAIPSMGTLLSFGASCCGAATCSAVCSSCGSCQNSILTRIAYALLLLLNSLLSWLLMTDWAVKKLQSVLLDYVTIDCAGKQCFGFAAVHRVNFALGLFHFMLAVMLLGVNNSRDKRAPIQNGFWGPKIVVWLGLIVGSFLIPNRFFELWGNYVALVGAMLFLLLGLVLLVDLAHTFAEYCIDKIEDTDSAMWRGILIGSTVGMYLGSIAMTVVMYIFFARSGCSMNQAAITVNLLALLAISILSIHPAIQSSNPRAGLAQAATVAIYCTYLTFSAVAMEPDDKQCNPLVRATGTRQASIVLGAVVTFVTCAYTTTRAATYGLALGTGKPPGYNSTPADDAETGSHDLIATQPESRKAMRAEALRRAVSEGVLPASALNDSEDSDSDDDEPSGKHKNDDEKHGTAYNYALFHLIFLLATAWIATLLTQNIGGSDHGFEGDFVPVGRTYWASWVKIGSSWVCYGIFGWTLVAPLVLPGRFEYS